MADKVTLEQEVAMLNQAVRKLTEDMITSVGHQTQSTVGALTNIAVELEQITKVLKSLDMTMKSK